MICPFDDLIFTFQVERSWPRCGINGTRSTSLTSSQPPTQCFHEGWPTKLFRFHLLHCLPSPPISLSLSSLSQLHLKVTVVQTDSVSSSDSPLMLRTRRYCQSYLIRFAGAMFRSEILYRKQASHC